MFGLIQQLCSLSGPSAQEGPVLTFVDRLWRDAGLQTKTTRVGNLLGRLGGRGPKLLLVAHADELCYLVRAVHPQGYLWLANGQAWSRTVSPRDWFTVGQRVRVLARTGELPGVIGSVTGHVATLRLGNPGELTWDDLWVDTGLTRLELLARGVAPGTRVIWDASCIRMGSNLVGKALDDRLGVAVLCEVARSVPRDTLAWDVTLACTVQEEIGVVGASALAAREQFAAAVIVESGLAGDVPGIGEGAMPLQLGAGPALVIKDSLAHYDHALASRLTDLAMTTRTPIQPAVFGSFGSDGSAFMRADVPAALIAIPTRYTHTPFETAALSDVEALVALLRAFLAAPAA